MSISFWIEEYEALRNEHSELRKRCETLEHEKVKARGEAAEAQRTGTMAERRMESMRADYELCKEELEKLQSHNLFWRNKVNSLREELQKAYAMQTSRLTTGMPTASRTGSSDFSSAAEMVAAEVARKSGSLSVLYLTHSIYLTHCDKRKRQTPLLVLNLLCEFQ